VQAANPAVASLHPEEKYLEPNAPENFSAGNHTAVQPSINTDGVSEIPTDGNIFTDYMGAQSVNMNSNYFSSNQPFNF